MNVVAELPRRVREVEHLWVPLASGLRIAGRLWLPEDAEAKPVPAILEMIPYRKRDMTAQRDTATHGYLAGHGYACLRVDVRGTGESEGVYADQFSPVYADDAVEIIARLARQKWCDGLVAMFGLSWGGAISLQTAARRPPALGAIVVAAGVDDRHALRRPGGCLTTAAITGIAAQMLYATKPPDPALVGEAWRTMWRERLEAARPVGEAWLRHRARDAFWTADSLARDYTRIACPVLLAAGWADPGFAAAALRVLERAAAPRRAILGPWGHRYPHSGRPGPAIGWLQETLRWLDHWLKGLDTGAMAEPMLRAWINEDPLIDERPTTRRGRWIAEEAWPSPALAPTVWHLGADGLAAAAPAPATRRVPDAPLSGARAGEAMPIFTTGANPELAGDQRDDDAASLVFDSAPLDARLEMLGAPELRLRFAHAPAGGDVAARLCELRSDGASRRVTYGFGRIEGRAATIRMFETGDGFAPGSRIRVALSRGYWPLLWPAPGAGALELDCAGSTLTLPVRRAGRPDVAAPPGPEAAATLEWIENRPARYAAETREEAGARVIAIEDDIGEGRLARYDLTLTDATRREFRLESGGAGARLETTSRWTIARGGWRVAATVRGRARADGDAIALEHEIEAREGDAVVFERRWRSRIVPGDG